LLLTACALLGLLNIMSNPNPSSVSTQQWLSERLGSAKEWSTANPGTAIAVTNAATAAFFLYMKAQEQGGVLPAAKAVLKSMLEGAVQAAAGGTVEAEIRSTAAKIEDKVLGDDRNKRSLIMLPEKGLPKKALLADLQLMAARVSDVMSAFFKQEAIMTPSSDAYFIFRAAGSLFRYLLLQGQQWL
jgi:hypothetical protein